MAYFFSLKILIMVWLLALVLCVWVVWFLGWLTVIICELSRIVQFKRDGTRWRTGKWRGNWRMESVASTPHINSEHGVSSITTADAHTSAASSQLNGHPWRFKWTRLFRRTKSGFCACAITFQTQCTSSMSSKWMQICLEGSFVHLVLGPFLLNVHVHDLISYSSM